MFRQKSSAEGNPDQLLFRPLYWQLLSFNRFLNGLEGQSDVKRRAHPGLGFEPEMATV